MSSSMYVSQLKIEENNLKCWGVIVNELKQGCVGLKAC